MIKKPEKHLYEIYGSTVQDRAFYAKMMDEQKKKHAVEVLEAKITELQCCINDIDIGGCAIGLRKRIVTLTRQREELMK